MALKGHEDLTNVIRAAAESVTSSNSYENWLATETGATGVTGEDIAVINNSFVYRDGVATTKNAEYLCMQNGELKVCRPPGFNADYKLFTAKSANRPEVTALDDAVQTHLSSSGRLVFLLIGRIDDSVGAEASIEHSLFDSVKFDPDASMPVTINGSVIIISKLTDPEEIWTKVEELARNAGSITESLPENLEAPFAIAFERLKSEAFSLLHLPSDALDANERDTLLSRILASLDGQISTYEQALARCGGDAHRDPQAFSEVLRIAYNFAGDATSLIQLLVSVCDLKPILMWCTLPEHFELAEAFRKLPWIKSKKKPSLGLYRETIAGARNHLFHDLFAFDRSLEVDVEGISLAARRLQLFPAYASGRRTPKGFEYEDQELVDLLSGFTRAPETSVSSTFWRRNAEVMHALQALLSATITGLELLKRSQ